MAGKPIPISTANDMTADYVAYMTKLGVDMNHQTQNVGFTNSDLMNWLTMVQPFTDELRIFMGRYPDGHDEAGRTTVILWPYKDGKPASRPVTIGKGDGDDDFDPYNEGSHQP